MGKKQKAEDDGGVAVAERPENATVQLALADVIASANNPRKHFDPVKMDELKLDIQRNGQLTPVLVLPEADGRYELLDGERRWRALQELGELWIEAKIKAVANQAEAVFLRLIANAMREGISPLEEAAAYQSLVDAEIKVAEIAEKIQQSESHVYGRLKLLKLPEFVRERLSSGGISAGHAERLVPLEEHQQSRCCTLIGMNEWSVRDLDRFIADEYREKAPAAKIAEDNSDEDENAAGTSQSQNEGEALMAGAREDLAREESSKPEKKVEETYRDGPVKDRKQLSGEKLTAAIKLETETRRQIFSNIFADIGNRPRDYLVNLCENQFGEFERDSFDEACEVARLFGKEAGAWSKWIKDLKEWQLLKLLYAMDMAGLIIADEFSISQGRPEVLLSEAKRWGVNIKVCEEAAKLNICGAPKKAKAAKKGKTPAKVNLKKAIAKNKAKAKPAKKSKKAKK